MNKEESINKLILRLKKTMAKANAQNNYEKAMAAIAMGSQLLYEYNQYYTDYDFENGVLNIAEYFKKEYSEDIARFHKNDNTVLFYDGFGTDTRGVSKNYLNALKNNGYQIIYVTSLASKDRLIDTERILQDADACCYYIDFKTSYIKWMRQIISVILETSPKAMFYYTTPYDVSAAVAFAVMDGKVNRFLIDLTDHAFWLGADCNDFFCGSREMSASNQIYERGISREKTIKLGVDLIVDDYGDHSGLPFDVTKERYIFSGGALYKTLGDPNNYYYRIIDHILQNNTDVLFLYAGNGDRSEMDTILQKYPGRAFIINERKDFYHLIKNCTLYLNTYPMFGGMMMKYSAKAGKIPITLKHENDSDGLLLDQNKRKIEYDTYEELIEDVDKLLSDSKYLKKREALLKGSIITEKRFSDNLKSAIENHTTDYEHSYEHIDTTKFKEEFYNRFDINTAKTIVAKPLAKSLVAEFPWLITHMIKKTAIVVNNKLRK